MIPFLICTTLAGFAGAGLWLRYVRVRRDRDARETLDRARWSA